ncbi:hypothetical protein SCHPADRAFT_341846 [Schizopora paradoxa]|uniref:Protein kinase domain-containing protein n=1 Tax=Schizopora paradoxa TaxID=27342 RepID=A0A0H2RPY7_9AGAM|nr:hypothetical protein SCHPADRAFT_341846 [Schizopora paradoxa]
MSSSNDPLLYDFTETDSALYLRDIGARWMAPELFYPVWFVKGNFTISRPSAETNVWALGMVIHELLTGDVPFSEIKKDGNVIMAIMDGEVPKTWRSASAYSTILQDIASRCWKQVPAERLSIDSVLSELNAAFAADATAITEGQDLERLASKIASIGQILDHVRLEDNSTLKNRVE